jgi:F-type H+-transporting ATPase subunit O
MKSASFRSFIENTSNTKAEVEAVLGQLSGTLDETTIQFLSTLIESKRISDLPAIAKKYDEYYKLLNKEEGATVISARELNAEQKKKVQRTLEETYKGTSFTIKYEVDPSILGGLQIYFGNSFMDASLLSRVNTIRGEFEKLSM